MRATSTLFRPAHLMAAALLSLRPCLLLFPLRLLLVPLHLLLSVLVLVLLAAFVAHVYSSSMMRGFVYVQRLQCRRGPPPRACR